MNRQMRRASSRIETGVRRHVGMHPLIAAVIASRAKGRRAAEIARPMRELFRELLTGEVSVIDGKAVMRLPELDKSLRQAQNDWVEIAPAIYGWIDCWAQLAPNVRQDKLKYLADRLDGGKMATERLVEQAREQFEAAIAMIPSFADGAIRRAVLHSQIRWEMEKLEA